CFPHARPRPKEAFSGLVRFLSLGIGLAHFELGISLILARLLGVARQRVTLLERDSVGSFRLRNGDVIRAVGFPLVRLLVGFRDVGVRRGVSLGLRLLGLGVAFRGLIT